MKPCSNLDGAVFQMSRGKNRRRSKNQKNRHGNQRNNTQRRDQRAAEYYSQRKQQNRNGDQTQSGDQRKNNTQRRDQRAAEYYSQRKQQNRNGDQMQSGDQRKSSRDDRRGSREDRENPRRGFSSRDGSELALRDTELSWEREAVEDFDAPHFPVHPDDLDRTAFYSSGEDPEGVPDHFSREEWERVRHQHHVDSLDQDLYHRSQEKAVHLHSMEAQERTLFRDSVDAHKRGVSVDLMDNRERHMYLDSMEAHERAMYLDSMEAHEREMYLDSVEARERALYLDSMEGRERALYLSAVEAADRVQYLRSLQAQERDLLLSSLEPQERVEYLSSMEAYERPQHLRSRGDNDRELHQRLLAAHGRDADMVSVEDLSQAQHRHRGFSDDRAELIDPRRSDFRSFGRPTHTVTSQSSEHDHELLAQSKKLDSMRGISQNNIHNIHNLPSQLPVEQMSQEAVSLAILNALGASMPDVSRQTGNGDPVEALLPARMHSAHTAAGATGNVGQYKSDVSPAASTCPLVSCRASVPDLRQHILVSHLPSSFADPSDTSTGTMRQRSVALHGFAQEFTDGGGLPGLLDMVVSSGLMSGVADVEHDLVPSLCAFSEFLGETVPERYTLNPPNACAVLTHWRVLLQLLCAAGKDVQERFSRLSQARKAQQTHQASLQPEGTSSPAPNSRTSHQSDIPQSFTAVSQSVASMQSFASQSASTELAPVQASTSRTVSVSSDSAQKRSLVVMVNPTDSDVKRMRQLERATTHSRTGGGVDQREEDYRRMQLPCDEDISEISGRNVSRVEYGHRSLNQVAHAHPDLHHPNIRHPSSEDHGRDREMSPVGPPRPLGTHHQLRSSRDADTERAARGPRSQDVYEPIQGGFTKSAEPFRGPAHAAPSPSPDTFPTRVLEKAMKAGNQRRHQKNEMKSSGKLEEAWQENWEKMALEAAQSHAFVGEEEGVTEQQISHPQSIATGRSLVSYSNLPTEMPPAIDCHFYLDVVGISLFSKAKLVQHGASFSHLLSKFPSPDSNHISLAGAVGSFSNPEHYDLLDKMAASGRQRSGADTLRWKHLTQDGRLGLSVGFNPKYFDELTDGLLDCIKQMTRLPGMKAYGDVGLSYSMGSEKDWSKQRINLRKLLRIAPQNLPVKLSCRKARESESSYSPNAYRDLLTIASEELPSDQPIYLCSFTGSADAVRLWSSQFPHCYFGISPKNIVSGNEVGLAIRSIPEGRLLLESSAPAFPLTGYRKNSPLFLGLLAMYVAKFRGLGDAREVLAITTENARRLFKLP
ncbi:hypothetical protein BaRGS_00008400 [Batillaria attramentaria]|uniref:Uncharacterized protein n=1 Tax=Batillaria attramentaria TaxID=370345 RepID=A0ABD0LNC7_9CAEN